MRPVKWILIALVGILALLLAGVWIVTRWVDPNVFKPRIVAALSAATGRPVTLPGDLELAWYPWLAVRAGEGSLGNPPGWTAPPLLRWREARLGARLLPLLRGEFVLDRLRFDGLDLQLRRDAAGRGNWDGLADAARGREGSTARPLTLAGVDLRDARIRFADQGDGTDLLVDALELTTGAWSAGQMAPIELEAGFALSLGGRPVLQQSRLTTRLALPGTDGRLPIALGPTALSTRVSASELAPGGVPVSLELPAASLDLDRSSVRVPSLQAAVGAARLALRDLAYDRPGEAPPAAAASFSLPPTSLRALLVAFGIEPPVTADPRALESFGIEGRFALAGGVLTIEPLTIVLDDTRLSGRVQRGGAPPLAEFTLAGNRMDVDRYLEPDEVASEPFRFPGKALGELRARGTLALENATFDGLAFEGLVVRLQVDEGGLRGDPAATRATTGKATVAKPPAARADARREAAR